jgi:hypothetical protein
MSFPKRQFKSQLDITLTTGGKKVTHNYVGRIWADNQEEANNTFEEWIKNEKGFIDISRIETLCEYKMISKAVRYE